METRCVIHVNSVTDSRSFRQWHASKSLPSNGLGIVDSVSLLRGQEHLDDPIQIESPLPFQQGHLPEHSSLLGSGVLRHLQRSIYHRWPSVYPSVVTDAQRHLHPLSHHRSAVCRPLSTVVLLLLSLDVSHFAFVLALLEKSGVRSTQIGGESSGE